MRSCARLIRHVTHCDLLPHSMATPSYMTHGSMQGNPHTRSNMFLGVIGRCPSLAGVTSPLCLDRHITSVMEIYSLYLTSVIYNYAGMCPRWSAVVGIGHHSKVAGRHSSLPTATRPGTNVLQELPIILFCTASKSFLLFSFSLQLFQLIFSITVHVSWT